MAGGDFCNAGQRCSQPVSQQAAAWTCHVVSMASSRLPDWLPAKVFTSSRLVRVAASISTQWPGSRTGGNAGRHLPTWVSSHSRAARRRRRSLPGQSCQRHPALPPCSSRAAGCGAEVESNLDAGSWRQHGADSRQAGATSHRPATVGNQQFRWIEPRKFGHQRHRVTEVTSNSPRRHVQPGQRHMSSALMRARQAR